MCGEVYNKKLEKERCCQCLYQRHCGTMPVHTATDVRPTHRRTSTQCTACIHAFTYMHAGPPSTHPHEPAVVHTTTPTQCMGMRQNHLYFLPLAVLVHMFLETRRLRHAHAHTSDCFQEMSSITCPTSDNGSTIN